MKLTEGHLQEALNDRKLFDAPIYKMLGSRDINFDVEEGYLHAIALGLTALWQQNIDYRDEQHIKAAIRAAFNNAFLDAIQYANSKKREAFRHRVSLEDSTNASARFQNPEELLHYDDNEKPVDEIDFRLKQMKPLLCDEHFTYLDLRLNGMMKRSEACLEMGITERQADKYLDTIKRQAKPFNSGYVAYDWKPYGEVDERNTLEAFYISEHDPKTEVITKESQDSH